MLDLSPTKLIIVFVVVVVLLGPKRLPEVARQLGAGWRKLRDLHGKLDSELRQTVPDLPTSQEIVRFARSPITLLNQLADRNGEPAPQQGAGVAVADGAGLDGFAANGAGDVRKGAAENGHGPRAAAPTSVAPVRPSSDAFGSDDPNLN